MSDIPPSLPPGWDCKYDSRSSRYYFVNHYTKTTTWEDPRLRYRTPSIPTEHIPLQHGSPEFRRNYVYPSQTCPQPAFQMPKTVPIQDLNNISRMSPVTSRASSSTSNHKNSPLLSHLTSRLQETSLTPAATDTEQSVAKISTMFPTVSETHIRLLLKKYYNREAVVISALQVEKYPITTPGPYTTPPPSRNFQMPAVHVPLHMTPPAGVRNVHGGGGGGSNPISRPGSGSSGVGSPLIGDYRNSPKPHSSPKMKLRYMKSIFPKVEEMILLEVLGNNENNVQKASDVLKEMGYEKRDIRTLKTKTSTKPEQTKPDETKPKTPQLIRMLSLEDKNDMKITLQEKYKDIPERVIVIALESVDYNKSRAIQILDIMVQEESSSKSSSNSTPKKEEDKIVETSTNEILRKSKSSLITPSPSIHTLRTEKLDTKVRRIKERNNSIREPLQENHVSNENDPGYKSSFLIKTTGPNLILPRGSDNKMLLEDYVSWEGPNPNLREGSKTVAKGPNRSLLLKRNYEPCGPKSENWKGPAFGLAKGSIYSQLKKMVVGESRGK